MAIYKRGREFELGTTEHKSSKWPERDSNPGPPDFESDALTTRTRCLLFAYSVRIAVKPFTDRTVLPLTKESCVSDSKSVPSAVKRTSFQRKRNMCVVNIDAPIAKVTCAESSVLHTAP